MKLKLATDVNSDATDPAPPETVEETMYGMKLVPSKRAVDAFPNDESSNEPEIISIRSDSMILLAACVF